MLPCLLQVRTVAWTIQGDLPLLAAALRANSPVDCGTKAFLFSDLANGATHEINSPF
jgi:hypothetical protein